MTLFDNRSHVPIIELKHSGRIIKIILAVVFLLPLTAVVLSTVFSSVYFFAENNYIRFGVMLLVMAAQAYLSALIIRFACISSFGGKLGGYLWFFLLYIFMEKTLVCLFYQRTINFETTKMTDIIDLAIDWLVLVSDPARLVKLLNIILVNGVAKFNGVVLNGYAQIIVNAVIGVVFFLSFFLAASSVFKAQYNEDVQAYLTRNIHVKTPAMADERVFLGEFFEAPEATVRKYYSETYSGQPDRKRYCLTRFSVLGKYAGPFISCWLVTRKNLLSKKRYFCLFEDYELGDDTANLLDSLLRKNERVQKEKEEPGEEQTAENGAKEEEKTRTGA